MGIQLVHQLQDKLTIGVIRLLLTKTNMGILLGHQLRVNLTIGEILQQPIKIVMEIQ